MTEDAFVAQILDMRQTLYRVSYGLLPNEQDRLDAVQECLAKAWEKRHTLKQPDYLRTWVTRILINECRTIGRKHQRVTPMAEPPESAWTPPPDADLAMHEAIVDLPEKLRLPLILHYMEGYAIREVAAMLRLPQGTVSTRLRRARLALLETLKDGEVLSRA